MSVPSLFLVQLVLAFILPSYRSAVQHQSPVLNQFCFALEHCHGFVLTTINAMS